jgi:hypothetical protein
MSRERLTPADTCGAAVEAVEAHPARPVARYHAAADDDPGIGERIPRRSRRTRLVDESAVSSSSA